MKKLLTTLGLVAVLAQGALAWRPAGWVYHDYPWAYDGTSGDWYWFHTLSRQWVARMDSGAWATLPNSALATGWAYYDWAFAFCQDNGVWYWFNEPDVQPVVNMRTGEWSRFGEDAYPADLVLIPGGTNHVSDPDFGLYELALGSFRMGRTEVTKAQWDQVHAWAITNGYAFDNAGDGRGPNHPVHTVNWYDCVKWCNARSEKEGRRPIYYYMDGSPQVYRTGQRNLASVSIAPGQPGYALPTEAQWEYAARGGFSSRRFPWGTQLQHTRANYYSRTNEWYDTSLTRGFHPDYNVPASASTSPAGTFDANAYGLYDVVGNVVEWCWTRSSDLTYERVQRGGCWADNASLCRLGARQQNLPTIAHVTIGFRVVLMPF
jgi:formylglycine-generating enzyme required for sulfatase activity